MSDSALQARQAINASRRLAPHLTQQQKNIAYNYAKCMISPYDNPSRIPSSFRVDSSLFRTRQTFNVSVQPTGEAAGKFAYFVQPKLGTISEPMGFKIGLIDYSNGIPDDLNDPSAYSQVLTPNSLSLDVNALPLTQSPVRVMSVDNGGNIPAPLINPLLGMVDNVINGITVTYGLNSTVTPVIDASYPAGGYSVLKLAPGSYLLNWTGLTLGANPGYLLEFEVFDGDTDVTSSRVRINNQRRVDVDVNEHMEFQSIGITIHENDWLRVSSTDAISSIQGAHMDISSAVSPALAWNSTNGIAESLRPVGLSVLSTPIQPTLLNAGQTIALLSPPKFADKVFTSAAYSDRWDNLDVLALKKGAFRTETKKGSYVWWSPSSEEDTFFRTVDEMNAHQFPMILISGTASPDAGQVFSVVVEFVFEMQSASQLFETKPCTGNRVICDAAIEATSGMVHCTENKTHHTLLGDLANVMGAAKDFIPFVGPMLSFL